MRVSVAMCTYNGGAYLRQQMDSIFNQTRLPDEIVVCDDISKDNTCEILETYLRRGVDLRICRNEENLGFVKNFRKCLSLCTGDVIFLCDQDDVWKPEKVQEICDLMERNPQMLSVVTNFHLIDGAGNRIGRGARGDNPFFDRRKHRLDWKKGDLYKINVKAIFSCNIGPGCAQAIRRELVPDFQDCPLNDPHDYVLNRFAALRDGLYYFDKPLTEYRYHENQTIGVPVYVIARFRRKYWIMAEEYINLPRELIYHVFFPNSGKVELPPQFNYSHQITFFDTVPMQPHLRKEYEQWRCMAQNRTILYAGERGKWKCFWRQGRYNKFIVFGYGLVERMRIRFWDLTMVLRREP